jgi:glycine/D-amino acid oxidase-like deaminating enzyme
MSLVATPTPVRHITYGHGIYLLPRSDGTTVLGATYERVGFDKGLTAGAIAQLLNQGAALVPELANARFDRAWAGLRPGSGDDLPIIGPVPGWENVSVATGHYREGIMLAPVTAAIIRDVIAGRESDYAYAHLRPERFPAL